MKKNTNTLSWKCDTPALFAEILGANDNMWVMRQPLIILDSIMREAARRAIELQDEKMIAIMARMGMYEACKPTHPEHAKISSIIDKHFNSPTNKH